MTLPPAPLTATDVSGELTGPAGAAVHARVRLAPPPQITPAALTGLLRPVHDADGALLDYTLDSRAVFAAGTEESHAAPQTFRAWRATWLAEWTLGELGDLQRFTAAAQDLAASAGTPLRVLGRLDFSDDVVDAASTVVLGDEVEATRQRLRAAPGEGLGLLDVTRRGFVRTIAPAAGTRVLLAASGARVLADADGLTLDFAGTLRTAGSGTDHPLRLHGWSVTGDGLVAATDDGDVPLGDGVAGRLLTWLAPGAVTVTLRRTPLTTVWAAALTGLADAADAAARAGRSVELTTAR